MTLGWPKSVDNNISMISNRFLEVCGMQTYAMDFDGSLELKNVIPHSNGTMIPESLREPKKPWQNGAIRIKKGWFSF
jgi:hypothetical protein